MKAYKCRFHAKGKYGYCWRSNDGQRVKPDYPSDWFDRCDGREKACPVAEVANDKSPSYL